LGAHGTALVKRATHASRSAIRCQCGSFSGGGAGSTRQDAAFCGCLALNLAYAGLLALDMRAELERDAESCKTKHGFCLDGAFYFRCRKTLSGRFLPRAAGI
jgi:hypothetical protein